MDIIVRGLICCIIPNIIFFIIYRKTPEFIESIKLVDKITKGKLSLQSRMIKISDN